MNVLSGKSVVWMMFGCVRYILGGVLFFVIEKYWLMYGFDVGRDDVSVKMLVSCLVDL